MITFKLLKKNGVQECLENES